MATKSTKSTKRGSTRRTSTRTASRPAPKTARECIAEYDVLRFHVTIITILSVVVCVLVAALLFLITRNNC